MNNLCIFGLSLLFSLRVFAAESSPVIELSSSDPLKKISEDRGTELADGNISTGTTSLKAFKLKNNVPRSNDEMKSLVATLFATSYKYYLDEQLPEEAPVKYEAIAYTKSLVDRTAFALAVGNAFDTSNGISKELRKLVLDVLTTLFVNQETKVGTAKVKVMSNTTNALTDVYYFLFLNPKSKKLVTFFIIEGTM